MIREAKIIGVTDDGRLHWLTKVRGNKAAILNSCSSGPGGRSQYKSVWAVFMDDVDYGLFKFEPPTPAIGELVGPGGQHPQW